MCVHPLWPILSLHGIQHLYISCLGQCFWSSNAPLAGGWLPRQPSSISVGWLEPVWTKTNLRPKAIVSRYECTWSVIHKSSGYYLVSPGSVVVPSLCYKVENDNQVCSGKRVLHLFLFLQRKLLLRRGGDGGEGGGGGGEGVISNMDRENDQWAFLIDLTASVRANFSIFISRCADRIPRAVQGALNKLLHNYSSDAKVRIYLHTLSCHTMHCNVHAYCIMHRGRMAHACLLM